MMKKQILKVVLLLSLTISCATAKQKPVLVKLPKPSCANDQAMTFYKDWIYNKLPSLPDTPKPKMPQPTVDQFVDILFCVIEFENLQVFSND